MNSILSFPRLPGPIDTRTHTKLRGNALARSKAYFVSDMENVPIYGFPAFQYKAVEKEYKLIKVLLRLQQLIKEKFNNDVNHCIVTLYQDQNDQIKYHSDDPKTIDPSTPIFFFSLGYQRPLARDQSKESFI